MGSYRKKPVVIEAFQMTPENRETNVNWPEWLHAAWQKERQELGSVCDVDGELYIETLEGSLRVSPGDWIIQGVQGELYPCKPDIFEATYEVAEELVGYAPQGLGLGGNSDPAFGGVSSLTTDHLALLRSVTIQPLTTDQLQDLGLGQSAPMTPEQFQAMYLQSPGSGSAS